MGEYSRAFGGHLPTLYDRCAKKSSENDDLRNHANRGYVLTLYERCSQRSARNVCDQDFEKAIARGLKQTFREVMECGEGKTVRARIASYFLSLGWDAGDIEFMLDKGNTGRDNFSNTDDFIEWLMMP